MGSHPNSRRNREAQGEEAMKDENCHQCEIFKDRIRLCEDCTRSEV